MMTNLRNYRAAWRSVSAWLLVNLLVACGRCDDFPTPSLADVDPEGIRGSLVVCGGGPVPNEVLDRFLQLAGGKNARLVVIPTAGDNVDRADRESHRQRWLRRGFPNVDVLHTRDRSVADSDEFVKPLRSATAVWIAGGQQSKLARAYVGTRVEEELTALLNRDGVIGGSSAGAAIQSRLMIAFGNPEATVMRGFDLVPGAVIDQHFKARNRQPRSTAVLDKHPGYFGLGIDEGTAIVVRGRNIRVLGKSTVTVSLSKSANRPASNYDLSASQVADLTALRRAAIARAGDEFPPQTLAACLVESGSLMIVGGGKMTPGMWKRFVDLAGGSKSVIVYVPTASAKARLEDNSEIDAMKNAGAGQVTILHTSDRAESNRESFAEPLKQATGIWFGGGRQWRIVDAYENTQTDKEFHGVLRRGGVIGGSSAGATIQGEYLVRGDPLGNRNMMAEGYERGFGFLPGVAIDQHFSQRNRQADLLSVVQTFPQLLGIGIDESTALVVQESTAQIVGAGSVYFYDAAGQDGSLEPVLVSQGEEYDLRRRQPIE